MIALLIVPILILIILYMVLRKKAVKNTTPLVIVFVVNKSLKMSKGKIISQIAHAITNVSSVMLNNREMYLEWVQKNKKITIFEGDSNTIEELSNRAHIYEVKYSKIHDAGRTQIPSGSNTVLIIGPAEETKVNGWFNNLDLLE